MRSARSFAPSLLTSCLSTCIFACASASGTLRPLELDHPANERASEAPVDDPAAFLRDARGAPAPADPSATDAADTGDAAGTYVCPMHPRATSEQPGKCPECGMQLVPRETHEEHPHVR